MLELTLENPIFKINVGEPSSYLR